MADNNPEGGISSDLLLFEEKINKIRSQVNSKLNNQKHLALVLAAVEENLDEQKKERTVVAYFVSFLSLLDQSIKQDHIIDHDLIVTTAYFLDLIFPFTPKGLLKTKFSEILAKLALPLTNSESDAPLLRSTIGALESLLLAQDQQQWATSNAISPNRALVGLLEFCTDPRPKVRKRAQEAINKILSNPPASPSPIHISASICCEFALEKLANSLEEDTKSRKTNKQQNSSNLIHSLQLVSSITSANCWVPKKVASLCDILLEVSKTSDQYLINAAFSAFEGLFGSMSNANASDLDRLVDILNILTELKPSLNDTYLAASWLAVIVKGMEVFASLAPVESLTRLRDLIPVVSEYLASESSDIFSSAAHCLSALITETIPDTFLLQPSKDSEEEISIYEKVDEFIEFLASFIESQLFSIQYQSATRFTLEFITSVILKLRSRCNPYFLDILSIVGAWRTNELESFPYNSEAESLIAAYISSMGPEVVLSVLPLNLKGNSDGRAWLLPILRDNVRFSNLNFFKSEILPLVDFFETKINNSVSKESIHVKVFRTICDQIWSLLPHFCDFPRDLQVAYDDDFASKLSDLLYSRIDLRNHICNALRLLAESNIAYREGALSDDKLMSQQIPIKEAISNIEYLSQKSSNILSVLFNVFSTISPDSRGYVLETIDVYLRIIPKNDLEETFNKVCTILRDSLEKEQNKKSNNLASQQRLSVTMMDLIVAMAKYLPDSSYNALFSIFASTVSLNKDHLMQKRSYRILSKLSETDLGKESIKRYMGEIESVFLSTIETTHSSSSSSRLQALEIVLQLLPRSDLYFIPSILQEVILSTKNMNEKSRQISFQILIQMGAIMKEGGIVENSRIPGFEGSDDTNATLEEFFTMVSAGLAAQSQHMISATILALSCLIYEFKDSISTEVLVEISSTVELFLTHNSREIAKAAIGFVKVEVLSLPESIVRPNLKELLAKLMRWSHEHKEHFKSKVKHILERLMKKYGVELIENMMPKEDLKLVANIRKRQSRSKKKASEEQSADVHSKNQISAYDDILNDSDSDNEASDDNASGNGNQYIMETAEEPLNLLDRQTLARIASSKPKSRSKVLQKTKVQTRDDKLLFDGINENIGDHDGASGIDAYLDAVKQGPIRGQRNKLKFKKTKDEDDWSDSETEEKPKPINKHKLSKRSKISKPKLKSRKKF